MADMSKGMTIKIDEETNALLEFFLGWKRMRGERVEKSATVSSMVIDEIREQLPRELLAAFEKSQRGTKSK